MQSKEVLQAIKVTITIIEVKTSLQVFIVRLPHVDQRFLYLSFPNVLKSMFLPNDSKQFKYFQDSNNRTVNYVCEVYLTQIISILMLFVLTQILH